MEETERTSKLRRINVIFKKTSFNTIKWWLAMINIYDIEIVLSNEHAYQLNKAVRNIFICQHQCQFVHKKHQLDVDQVLSL